MSRPPYQKGDPRAVAAGAKGGRVGAARRRAVTQPYAGTILDLMDAAGMVGTNWLPWRAFWKSVYAITMDAAELAVFQRHTQRDTPPAAPVDEAYMPVGRGGGKTRNSALNAVFRAISFDAATVVPGESVTIPLIASTRKQAKQALGYVRGFCSLPAVRPWVHRGTLAETVEFTACNIEITTADIAAPRGYTSPSACCDEIAWWSVEGVNPDTEILTAVRGSLGRVAASLLLVLSNPYAPRGELYAAVESFYGVTDDAVLVWVADTLSMNPTYSQRAIARAFRRDPVVAMSEYGSGGTVAFRQAKQALFDDESVRACIVTDRRELPPVPGVPYSGFVDASQGQRAGDPMTLGIAHRDGTRAVLDLLREVSPPFNPADVVARFAGILQQYRIAQVTGDRVSLGFVLNEFAAEGIKFLPSTLSKSDLFSELLPLVNTGRVELLDHPTLRTQLLALERRAMRGGRDSIDHPRGAHDDVANAAAGALTLVTGVGAKPTRRVIASFGDGWRLDSQAPPTDWQAAQHAVMQDLIAQTKRRAEAQAERDWQRAQETADLPMQSMQWSPTSGRQA